MSNPAFLTDGSGIAPHIPLAKVRKVGLGGETAHVGYFLQRVVCRPQQLLDTFDTALTQPRGGRAAENPLETPAEGNRAGIPANPSEFRDVIRGKIIRFDTGDELVIVPQVQQLLELPDIGGSEMFIRGVEHFQHDSSVTFNGHTQCLTGFTQVILESQPQRVVMRVGTLGQNGADRPQFIDTTIAEIPRYKTLDVMDGMKFLRKHQKKQERGEILVFPRYGTGCFVKQGGDVPHQQRISRVRFYLFGTAGIIPVTRYDRRQSIELHGVNAFYKGRAKTVVNG